MSSWYLVSRPIPEPVPRPAPPQPAYSGLPCVWMSAGLVAYKLCDRGFECESCPFDQAMRGALPPPAPRPDGSENGDRPRRAATRRGGPFRPFRVGRGAASVPTIEPGSDTGSAGSQGHVVSIHHRSVR